MEFCLRNKPLAALVQERRVPRWACVTTYFLLNSMDYKCKSTICGRLLQDIGIIQDNEQDIEPGGQRSRKRAVVDFGRAHEEQKPREPKFVF